MRRAGFEQGRLPAERQGQAVFFILSQRCRRLQIAVAVLRLHVGSGYFGAFDVFRRSAAQAQGHRQRLVHPRLNDDALSQVGLEELDGVLELLRQHQEIGGGDNQAWVTHSFDQGVLPDLLGIEIGPLLAGVSHADVRIALGQGGLDIGAGVDDQVARPSRDGRAGFNCQRLRGREEAKLVVFLVQSLWGGGLVVQRINRLAGDGIEVDGPVPGPAHHLADEGDKDLALVAALEAELTAQVAELTQLLSAEADNPAANAQVALSLEIALEAALAATADAEVVESTAAQAGDAADTAQAAEPTDAAGTHQAGDAASPTEADRA